MENLPASSSPQTHPDASRTSLLDAAERVFAARGFADGALSAIAAEAGVTKSLIHHHFGSKASLWIAVLARRFEEYEALQREILDRTATDLASLEVSLRAFFDFLVRNPAFVRLHGWTNAGDGPGFHDTSDLTQRGVERLRALQRSGGLRRDVDPAAVLAAFFALVEHWFQARADLISRFGDELPDDDRYLETIARLLIDGIQP